MGETTCEICGHKDAGRGLNDVWSMCSSTVPPKPERSDADMPEKVTVYKVAPAAEGVSAKDNDGCYLAVAENDLAAIGDSMIGAEPGDVFIVTVEEWEAKELDMLPEWDGW